jgi:cbb3-type cytochrome oxidase subunit 3
MFRNVLPGIEHVDGYAIFSLLLFFIFFIGMGIYVLRMSKQHIRTMEQLPFDESTSETLNTERSHD